MSRYYDDVLMHYGAIGQKWGRRLYQYKDGTLTPLGRKRYAKLAADKYVLAKGALSDANEATNETDRYVNLRKKSLLENQSLHYKNHKANDGSDDSITEQELAERIIQKAKFHRGEEIATRLMAATATGAYSVGAMNLAAYSGMALGAKPAVAAAALGLGNIATIGALGAGVTALALAGGAGAMIVSAKKTGQEAHMSNARAETYKDEMIRFGGN